MSVVLKQSDVDYSGMTRIGMVEICEAPNEHGVHVVVRGFEFEESETCRTHCAKAMAWARDVLAAQVEAEILAPGGAIVGIRGEDQEELDLQRE